MLMIDTQLTASEVLRAFHHDEPKPILGSAFNTSRHRYRICMIRRRLDPLLVWLAIFAHLYGARLWLDSDILGSAVPDSQFLPHLAGGNQPANSRPCIHLLSDCRLVAKAWQSIYLFPGRNFPRPHRSNIGLWQTADIPHRQQYRRYHRIDLCPDTFPAPRFG